MSKPQLEEKMYVYILRKSYDYEAEEILGTPIEAITEDVIILKPKRFRSDAHIYDLDANTTIRRSIKTLPDRYWEMENDDIATYMLTGGE